MVRHINDSEGSVLPSEPPPSFTCKVGARDQPSTSDKTPWGEIVALSVDHRAVHDLRLVVLRLISSSRSAP
jgi:hypothetical protein